MARFSSVELSAATFFRPSVGTGATGAKAPVNFEQLVLGTRQAPVLKME